MNPIAAGADPWVVSHEGTFFWCESIRGNAIAIHSSANLISRDERRVVWTAPPRGPFSRQIWAPELHRLDGRWFIYVAASNGRNQDHRMIVLEGGERSPLENFHFKAMLYTGDDIQNRQHNRWAIDGTPFEYNERRYFLWSGWEHARDDQYLYIGEMENPWTVASNRVKICANDDYVWERVGESMLQRGLNEGPQVLVKNGRVFVVYSASGSWQHTYKLGLLELAPNSGPMIAANWRKHPEPIFQSSPHVWGVGHGCFTQSPDGSQHWMAYHSKRHRRQGWDRSVHVQEFTWTETGIPHFGAPALPGHGIVPPSGSDGKRSTSGQLSLDFNFVAA